jgi:hypothetical protein
MGVCDGLLMLSKNLSFIIVHKKDSLSDNLAEWFIKSTYEEYLEKVNANIDVTIPVEGIPIEDGGAYTKEQFKKAQELIQQGKYKKLTKQEELEYVQKNIGVIELADKYEKCIEKSSLNSHSAGLHLSTEINAQDIVLTVWWIPDTTSEMSPRLESYIIEGATYTQGFPDKLKIKPTGYSILLHREENSTVTIVINTTKGSVSETIPAPNITSNDDLGTKWIERESDWNGVWIRRGNSNIFDATWSNRNYPDVTAVLTINRAGNKISIARRKSSDGNDCDYVGTIADDKVTVSGTYKCIHGGTVWTATISYD